jgi:hypothetical protein
MMSPLVARAVREYRAALASYDPRGLAFDRASARTFDSNGNLHVERSHISKAAVNDYYGQEINAAMQGGHRMGLGEVPELISRRIVAPGQPLSGSR